CIAVVFVALLASCADPPVASVPTVSGDPTFRGTESQQATSYLHGAICRHEDGSVEFLVRTKQQDGTLSETVERRNVPDGFDGHCPPCMTTSTAATRPARTTTTTTTTTTIPSRWSLVAITDTQDARWYIDTASWVQSSRHGLPGEALARDGLWVRVQQRDGS